jgi:hypothetical protein
MSSAQITPHDLGRTFAFGEHQDVYQLGCVGAERVTV